MEPNFFGGSDEEGQQDPPITEKDRLKRERMNIRRPKKTQEEIEARQLEQKMKKQQRENKKGAKIKKPKLQRNEEAKVVTLAPPIEKQVDEISIHKQFNVVKEVQDDPYFKGFFQQYSELKKINEEEVKKFERERYFGNIEYKLKLSNPNWDRIQHLTTQMHFRLTVRIDQLTFTTGRIGLEDHGNAHGLPLDEVKESLSALYFIARTLKAELKVDKIFKGTVGDVIEVMVRKNEIDGIKVDIKITMLGGEGAGKSTLLGVLISGQKDDGKGHSRAHVFRHKHELLDGRTSSISQQILGFDADGQVINQQKFGILSWAQIVEFSSKILTFIDVAGNEKYMKTMIQGICQHYPDYALMVIDATLGVQPTIVDHIKMAFAFGVPVIFVVTKIDKVSKQNLFDVTEDIGHLLKQISKKTKLVIREEHDAMLLTRCLDEMVTPIFQVSNKTGKGLEVFKMFLHQLPINSNWKDQQEYKGTEFQISEIFKIEGQQILSGIVISGTIALHNLLYLGPDAQGRFFKVEVKSIQCKRVAVRTVKAGQMCTIQVKLGSYTEKWLAENGGEIRKGMVLVDGKNNPKSTMTFKAEIWSFDGPKTVKTSYQPVIHCAHVRQAAVIMKEEAITKQTDELHRSAPTSSEEEEKTSVSPTRHMQTIQSYMKSDPPLLSNKAEEMTISDDPMEKTTVMFRFMYNPEYITVGKYLIINESGLKAFGKITEVMNDQFQAYPQTSSHRSASLSARSNMSKQIKLIGDDKVTTATSEIELFDKRQRTRKQRLRSMAVAEEVKEEDEMIKPKKKEGQQEVNPVVDKVLEVNP